MKMWLNSPLLLHNWQRLGLASRLLHIVILAASLAGYASLDGVILRENKGMRELARALGFNALTGHHEGPGVVRVRKALQGGL